MSSTEIPQPPPAPPPGSPAPAPTKGSNGLAVAGFVLGLLGLLSSWIPFLNILGIILGGLGVILAGIGLAKSRKAGAGKGLAITGLVLGALAILIAVIVNAAFVDAVDDAIDDTTDTSVETPSGSSEEPSDNGNDAELGTTRDNPAPMGSKITGGDWTVTVNSVKTAKQDSFGQAPEAGSTLLVINLTATYNGNDEQGDSAWVGLKFVTPDGTTIDATDGMFVAEDAFDSLKTVYHGASVTGDEMIQVPADDWKSGVLAVSPSLLADDTFVAVK